MIKRSATTKSLDYLFEVDGYATRQIRRTASNLIGRAGFTRGDREDIEQDLAVALLERLPHFDSQRGRLEGFVRGALKSAATSIVRQCMAQKRDRRRSVASLDQPFERGGDSGSKLADFIDEGVHTRRLGQIHRTEVERAQVRIDVRQIASTLPADLLPLSRALLVTSHTGAAKQLGVSRRAIRRGIARLGHHFGKASALSCQEGNDRS